MNKHRTTSPLGQKLIKGYEKFRPLAYNDNPKNPSKGFWTYGWGETINPSGKPVQKGETISLIDADIRFAKRLTHYETIVKNQVTVELNQNEFDACVSFCYNAGSLKKSLLEKINTKSVKKEDFQVVIHQGEEVLPGLVRRRKSEAEMFINGKLNFFE